jgi:methylmalonyl-CoA mutase
VRRAMAIQLIINKELGLAKNENPIQGAFIIEELTDLVEAAVLLEFDRITERGGVLVLWKPCTNVLKFKKKACIMKR